MVPPSPRRLPPPAAAPKLPRGREGSHTRPAPPWCSQNRAGHLRGDEGDRCAVLLGRLARTSFGGGPHALARELCWLRESERDLTLVLSPPGEQSASPVADSALLEREIAGLTGASAAGVGA